MAGLSGEVCEGNVTAYFWNYPFLANSKAQKEYFGLAKAYLHKDNQTSIPGSLTQIVGIELLLQSEIFKGNFTIQCHYWLIIREHVMRGIHVASNRCET